MSEPPLRQPLPGLNESAPDFTAETTYGPMTLSSLRGKWVVLFSHPADFTPVCTTELIEFARREPEFAQINTQLVGLSIDSIYSHIAWLRSIEQTFQVAISYPVIADLDMAVAQLYGMIHVGASNTSTVRCVFIIDDKGILRAMLYYPLTNGRNIDEILRLVTGIQAADKTGLATPCNWKPGDSGLLPAPRTAEEAAKRTPEPDGVVGDWYLTRKTMSA